MKKMVIKFILKYFQVQLIRPSPLDSSIIECTEDKFDDPCFVCWVFDPMKSNPSMMEAWAIHQMEQIDRYNRIVPIPTFTEKNKHRSYFDVTDRFIGRI